jgi:hypothetical protein
MFFSHSLLIWVEKMTFSKTLLNSNLLICSLVDLYNYSMVGSVRTLKITYMESFSNSPLMVLTLERREASMNELPK